MIYPMYLLMQVEKQNRRQLMEKADLFRAAYQCSSLPIFNNVRMVIGNWLAKVYTGVLHLQRSSPSKPPLDDCMTC